MVIEEHPENHGKMVIWKANDEDPKRSVKRGHMDKGVYDVSIIGGRKSLPLQFRQRAKRLVARRSEGHHRALGGALLKSLHRT